MCNGHATDTGAWHQIPQVLVYREEAFSTKVLAIPLAVLRPLWYDGEPNNVGIYTQLKFRSRLPSIEKRAFLYNNKETPFLPEICQYEIEERIECAIYK
jgi:hypothetical protein